MKKSTTITTNGEQQQQQQISIEVKTKTSTITPEKKSQQKLNRKPERDSTARPKPNLRVQGKPVSDINTLRDFLAKKQLERAARVKIKEDASHSKRPIETTQRDQHTIPGEQSEKPNQIIEGLELNAAKGNTVRRVTSFIGWNKPEGCD